MLIQRGSNSSKAIYSRTFIVLTSSDGSRHNEDEERKGVSYDINKRV